MFTCPFGPALPGDTVTDCLARCLCGPHQKRELQGAAIMADLMSATDKILKYGMTEDRVHEARFALDQARTWWSEFHNRVDVPR